MMLVDTSRKRVVICKTGVEPQHIPTNSNLLRFIASSLSQPTMIVYVLIYIYTGWWFRPFEKYYRLLPFMCRHRGGEQPLHPPAPSKLPVWGETGYVPLGSHLPSKLPEYVVVNSLELTVGPTEIIWHHPFPKSQTVGFRHLMGDINIIAP